MNTNHGTDLTAWWCENLHRFTAHADEHHWRWLLDAANNDILDGTPVHDALTAHGIDHLVPEEDEAETHKGWTDPADMGRMTDRVRVVGAYACPALTPARRCSRLADTNRATGHEPRCGLHRLPMTLQAPPPEGQS